MEALTAIGIVALVCGVFTVIGGAFTVSGIRRLRRTRKFVKGASTAPGVVVDFAVRRVQRTKFNFPVVKYETADGRVVQFESPTATKPGPKIGDEVTVLYDPLRPEEAQIKSVMMLWFLPGMFVAVGLPSLVFGALGLLVLIAVSLVLLF